MVVTSSRTETPGRSESSTKVAFDSAELELSLVEGARRRGFSGVTVVVGGGTVVGEVVVRGTVDVVEAGRRAWMTIVQRPSMHWDL